MPSRISKPSSLVKSNRVQLNNTNNNTANNNQVTLERVLGFTLSNNCALSLDCNSGNVAYTAGCVVVIRQLANDRQYFIQNASKKPLTALEFSPDGKFIATGESGHQPMVRLWSVADGSQLAEYAGHHFRVVAVRFSPSTRYLVSLGSQEDNTLYVWDRVSGQRVASAKVTNKINGIAFSPTGQFFVTVGVRHVRYWYLEPKRNRHKETLPLNGRNAILGDLLNNAFMDVSCTLRVSDKPDTSLLTGSSEDPTGSDESANGAVLTLIVSKAGQLMQFNDQRYLEKWVELRTSRASCLSTCGPWVVVGCARGTCLLFESETLQFLAQLPLPHSLGSDLQLNSPDTSTPVQPPPTTFDCSDVPLYPDLLAIKLDWSRARVVCCYADHSFYVWDIQELNNIRRTLSHFYHSRGVWSIDCFADSSSTAAARAADGGSPTNGAPSWWTTGAFVTCADDGTIRFWNLRDEASADDLATANSLQDVCPDWTTHTSAFQCNEQLLRIIYTDPSHKFLCVTDRPSAGIGPLGGPPCSPTVISCTGSNDSAAPSPSSPTVPGFGELPVPSQQTGCCVRAVCISPDCQHLAVGDRDGNLRVYALETLTAVCQIPAHDSEILSLSFFRSDSVPELALLCSASRDRLIHIFDPNQNYSLVQTVADHSAAIFAARIVETEEDGEIRLISCGMDKSLLIRVLEPDDAGLTAHFALEHHLVGRHSQLDAAFTPNVCPFSDGKSSQRRRYLAVACQDRRLRIYNVTTGRPVRCYRGSFNEDGCLVRCAIDPTGSIVATSGSDKQLNLFHLLTGESIATLCGHSELALGLRFLPDLRHLVSVSSDSCVFVWRLASGLVQHLADRTGRTIRTQSFSGFPSGVGSGSLRPVASLRWPRASCRTGGEQSGEDDQSCPSFQLTPTWTESLAGCSSTDQPLDGADDEDSELDLLRLDTNELLPHDSLQESGFGDVQDSSEDLDSHTAEHVSTDSFSSYQTAKSSRVAAQTRGGAPVKPTFYFSVSALPAWARRKLATTHPKASETEATGTITTLHATAPNGRTAPCSRPVRMFTDPIKPSFTLGNASGLDFQTGFPNPNVSPDRCSNDSLNSSQRGTDQASPPLIAECPHLMSTSDYVVSPVTAMGVVSTRVTDSRHLKSRALRSTTVSGEVSPRYSAPTTPFRRDRSWTERPETGRRSLRQPNRHTVSVASGLQEQQQQQQRGSFPLRSGSLRTRGSHAPHESITEIHKEKKTGNERPGTADTDDDDADADEDYRQAADASLGPAHRTIPPARKSNWAGATQFFPANVPSRDCRTDRAVPSSSVPNRSIASTSTIVNSSCTGTRQQSKPTSLVSAQSSKPGPSPSSSSSSTNSEQQAVTNRVVLTTSEANTQSDNHSPSSSISSSDPAFDSFLPTTSMPSSRPTSARPSTGTSLSSTETRTESARDRICSTTFASRQKLCINDSSSKLTSPRNNLTGGRLKKAVSSISVQHTGLSHNTSAQQQQRQSGRPQRIALTSSNVSTDDSVASTSAGSRSLGRATSHVQLACSPIGSRSPFVARARWLPSPTSPNHVGRDSATVTTEAGKSVSARPARSSSRPVTFAAAVRPSELSLARSSPAGSKQPASVTTTTTAGDGGGDSSQPVRASQKIVDTARPLDELNPDSSQPQDRSRARLIQADSSSNSTIAEADKFQATREALETLKEALELAVQRCSEFRDTEPGSEDDLVELRTLMTNELEWRFAQLRAMLGLSPICVDAPVARVLLADLVERLIPKLHVYSQPDGLSGAGAPASPTKMEQRKAEVTEMVGRQSSLTEWLADSTTEPAPTPVSTAPENVCDHVEPEDQDDGDVNTDAASLMEQGAYPDRMRWTVDGRTAVTEES